MSVVSTPLPAAESNVIDMASAHTVYCTQQKPDCWRMQIEYLKD